MQAGDSGYLCSWGELISQDGKTAVVEVNGLNAPIVISAKDQPNAWGCFTGFTGYNNDAVEGEIRALVAGIGAKPQQEAASPAEVVAEPAPEAPQENS